MEAELKAYKACKKRWYNDPALYARQRIGMNPTHQQLEILTGITPNGAHVSVRSGHDTGKSGAAAIVILWFIETRDHCRIPCTAPSAHQLYDVLWGEISKWIRHSDIKARKDGINPRFWLSNCLTLTRDRLYVNDSEKDWFASARTSKKETPDALQGVHATDVQVSQDGKTIINKEGEKTIEGKLLFVIEEAPGVPDEIFHVVEGAIASHGSRLLMLGNPTKNTGFFADSHIKNRSQYTCVHLSSIDSPLSNPEYRANLVRKYGEGSNVVRVRADGDFPTQGKDVLISFSSCESAITRPRNEFDVMKPLKVLSIDPARFGDDRSSFLVREEIDPIHIETTKQERVTETARRGMDLYDKYQCDYATIDTIGIGAGVADIMISNGYEVVEVVASEKAPDREDENDIQAELMRDHCYLMVKFIMETEKPSFIDCEREYTEDLAAELCDIKFGFKPQNGHLKVEPKDQIKKRLKRSPDIADAYANSFAPRETAWDVASSGTGISNRMGGY